LKRLQRCNTSLTKERLADSASALRGTFRGKEDAEVAGLVFVAMASLAVDVHVVLSSFKVESKL
jgi:hypothetical protein